MFRVTRSEMVGCRSDLARLCDEHGLRVAVEVGTERGLFAAEFLARWHGEILYCVDPYGPYNQAPWDRTADLIFAVLALQHEARRVRFVRLPSAEAATILGVRPDFVYIDGDHTFEAVRADIAAWWPLVRVGGILAGDDYDLEHHGVIQAVIEFAEMNDLEVFLTTDYNRPASWFVFKPEPIPETEAT